MSAIKITQANVPSVGGFPFDQETIQGLQNNEVVSRAVARIFGENCIIADLRANGGFSMQSVGTSHNMLCFNHTTSTADTMAIATYNGKTLPMVCSKQIARKEFSAWNTLYVIFHTRNVDVTVGTNLYAGIYTEEWLEITDVMPTEGSYKPLTQFKHLPVAANQNGERFIGLIDYLTNIENRLHALEINA